MYLCPIHRGFIAMSGWVADPKVDETRRSLYRLSRREKMIIALGGTRGSHPSNSAPSHRDGMKWLSERAGYLTLQGWRVAPVPATFSTQDEGAPGPSLLGTGDASRTSPRQTTLTQPKKFTSRVCSLIRRNAHT